MSLDRRTFVSLGSLGLAAGASALTLPVFAQPTEASGELGEQSPVFAEIAPPQLPANLEARIRGEQVRGAVEQCVEADERRGENGRRSQLNAVFYGRMRRGDSVR